jgi:catechol 2,3-dioxygenase-like lactoylglutathione lyase family enzyme
VPGIPGAGLGGLFYVLSAFVALGVELVATARGRSSRARWRAVTGNAILAFAITVSCALAYGALKLVVSDRPAGAGAPGGTPAANDADLTSFDVIPVAPIVLAAGLLALVLLVTLALGAVARRRRAGVTIAPTWLPVADVGRSKAFYSAALAPLGYGLVYEGDSELGFGVAGRKPFGVRSAETSNAPAHVAFRAASADQVKAFHAAGLAAGGYDDGPPADRSSGGSYYAAHVLDPDGNRVEALYSAA